MSSNDINQGKRILWIDNVRAVACVLVVLLHVSAYYLYKFKQIDMFTWNLANFIDAATRVCVPLFFMISGYIFMRNKEMKFKNISKIISCTIFYSIVSLLYLLVFKSVSISGLGFQGVFIKYLKTPAFYHLWFFYTIIVCYFFFALISVKNVSIFNAIAFASILFIFFNGRTSSYTNMLFGFGYYGMSIITNTIPFFILYSALGAIIGVANTDRIKNKVLLTIFLLSTMCTAYLTHLISVKNNSLNTEFYAYETFLVMWASVSIFIFIKNFKSDVLVFGRFTKYIASASLPIYGLHALTLDYINAKGWRFDSIFIDIPLTFFIIFFSSLSIGLLITKFDKKGLFS